MSGNKKIPLFFSLLVSLCVNAQFRPDSLPGLQVWLSADSGIVISSGDSVSKWTDRSINHNDAIQNIPSSQPRLIPGISLLNNNPVLRFDGDDDTLMINSGAQVSTAFIVFNWGGVTPNFPDYNGLITQQLFSPNARLFIVDGGTTNLHTAGGSAFFDPSQVYVNGMQIINLTPIDQYKMVSGVNPTALNFTNFVIGDECNSPGRFWNGDIAEIIIYNSALTTTQRQQVENYLHIKYAPPPVDLGPDIVMTTLCDTVLHASPSYISYAWSDGSTDSTDTVTRPGTYTVAVTDVFGVTSTDTINVTYPLNQLPDSNRLCANDTLIWHTNLTAPYTFAWSNGTTADTLIITVPGQYSVTVTDSAGICNLTSDVITVTIDSFPLIATLADSDTLCANQSITLATGASQAVSYLWSTGETTSSIVIDTTGNYSVIVHDVFGCTAKDTIHVYIQGTAPIIDFSAPATCLGDSSHFSGISTDSIVSWNWDFGDSFTDTGRYPSHLYAASGTYIVGLTVMGLSGCANSATDSVTVNPNPVAAFTYSQPLCHGDSIQFSDASSISSGSITGWQWDFGDVSSSDTSTQQNYTYGYVAAGTYNVKLIVNSSQACWDTTTVPVTVVGNNNCNFPTSGLQLWLAAGSSVLHVDSVTQLNDLSGNANPAVQTTPNFQPKWFNGITLLNYKPIVRLDGTNDFLNINNAVTVGEAFVIGNWGVNQAAFPGYNGILTAQIIGGSPDLLFIGEQATSNLLNVSNSFAGNIFIDNIQTLSFTPLNRYKIISGQTPTPFFFSNLLIGNDRGDSSRSWKGDVAEVIIYDNVLTVPQRDSVIQYLRDKYAPPVNLGPDIAMTTLCAVTLHASPRFISYVWNDGSTDSTLTVSRPGTYYVEVTDVFGFTSTDTINVSYPLHQLADTTICFGSTLVWNTNLSSPDTFLWSDFSTADTLAITAAGTYWVKVTEPGGCSLTSDTITVTVDNYSQVATLGNDTSICAGNKIRLVAGAGLTQTYLWSDNTTDSTLVIQTTGTYSVSVTDFFGCSTTSSIYVIVSGHAPLVGFTSTTVCQGQLTQFQDTTSTDMLNYWHWDFGDTSVYPDTVTPNPTHMYVSAGIYSVQLTVKDTGGCGSSVNQNDTIYPLAVPDFYYVQPTCMGDTTLFTDVSTIPSGSITGWHWDFGDPVSATNDTSTLQNPVHVFSSSGSFTVQLIVTSNHGCSDTVTQAVNIIPNNNCILPNTISGLQVWLSSDSGVTENLDTVSLWTDRTGLGHDANQNISGHQPLLVNGIPLLNYKPVLRFDGDDTLLINTGSKVSTAFIVFNWGGLTDTFPNYNGLMTQQTYTTNSRVFIVQKDTTTLFIGNSMIFEDSNKIFVNGNNTYNLSPIKRYKIVSAVNDTGVNISNFVIGDERSTQGRLWNGDIVEIIIYDNPISYQHRIDVETYLHNKYAPPVNLGPDVAMTTLCSHTLHASPRFISYEWNGDSLINDSTYTVTSSGTYYVQVTDVFGFTSTDTVNVTYPLNQIDTTNLLCLGSTLVWDTQLSSSFTYDWHGAPSTGPVLNITAAGNYYVTVTDNNNCTLTSETVHVAVDSFPQTASLGSSPASLCSGNIIGLISGAGQAESYLWYDGSTNPTHLVTNTQSYSVIVTDTNDCVAYDTIYVTVTGVAPTAIFTASSTCEGDVMQFTDSSNGNGSGIISWHWDFGDTSITSDTDTVQNPVYVYADTLSHTVTLTVNTAIGCSNYITQNVQVHQKPQVNFSVANACGGSPVQFTDNSTAVNQSVTGWYWDFGDPTSGGLNTSTLRNPLHIFNTEGNYFVSLIATTNFGCSDTLFRQVVVHKTVVPSFTNLPTCFGSLMQFTGFSNAGFSDIVTWDWNFGDSSPHSSVYPFPSHFYVAVGSYYVTLTATTSFNCVSTAASSVNVNPRPVADFSTASPCINTPYTFQDSSSIPSGSIVRWDWNIIGHATFDSVYAPVYTFNAQGTDSITLKVYSNAGCISTITKTLTVRPTPLPDFVMDPSYGTPPLFVAFNNYTANPNSNTYHWDFGDGVTNDSIAPHHTFSNTAYYTVCLTATTSPYGCKDTMCHTIYVIKPQRDVAVLSISETAANNGLSISAQVANLGTLDIDSVRMKATLPDGTSIEEVYNGPAGEGLPYGTGIPETFNFRARLILPPASPHDFYCVEATILPDNLVDDVPSNNEKCEAITGDFSLLNPYPNPTEGNLNLDVILPFSDHLAIELFNAIGQKISVLFDGTGAAGLNSLNADLAPLAEGMYAIRFTFRDNTKVRQVMKIGRKK